MTLQFLSAYGQQGSQFEAVGPEGPVRMILGVQPPGSITGLFNVRAFGALGNDAHNDAPAFAAATAAAVAAGGGIVYAPQGTYRLEDHVVGAAKVYYAGDGFSATVLHRVAGGVGTDLFAFTDINDFGVSSMTLVSDVGDAVSIHATTVDVGSADHPSALFRDVFVNTLADTFAAWRLTTAGGKFIYFPAFYNCYVDGGANVDGGTRKGLFTAGASNVIGLQWFGGRITRVGLAVDLTQAETSLVNGIAIDGCTDGAGTGTAIHIGPNASANYNVFRNLRLEDNEIQWKLEAGPAAGGTQVHCRTVAPPPTPAQAINNQNAVIDGVDPSNGFGVNNPTVFAASFPNLKQDTIAELTADAGVTADGTQLHNGGVVLGASTGVTDARFRTLSGFYIFNYKGDTQANIIVDVGGSAPGAAKITIDLDDYIFNDLAGTSQYGRIKLAANNGETSFTTLTKQGGVQLVRLIKAAAAPPGGSLLLYVDP